MRIAMRSPCCAAESNRLMPSVTITVAVLTFHRPEKLRRGLSLIVEQVEQLNADAGGSSAQTYW